MRRIIDFNEFNVLGFAVGPGEANIALILSYGLIVGGGRCVDQ